MRQDGRYSQIGASLRKGQLYVKAPYHKVVELVETLKLAGEDLLHKRTYWNGDSKHQPFVFAGSVEDWAQDVETLAAVSIGGKDPSGTVEEFRSAVVLGLDNNPVVDWVNRTDGPAPGASAPPAVPSQSECTEPARDVPSDLDTTAGIP